MNTRKFHQFIVCICLSAALLTPQQYVHAQGENFVEIPLEDLHDGKPIELQGLISAQALNIPVPSNWLLGENWIDILIRASPLLDLTRSAVTISLNNHPIMSYKLAEAMDVQQQIRLPANVFTPGNNTLTFTGTLYLPNDSQTNCQNWDDPSRWLAIESGGLLHLSFTRDNPQVDLSTFPQGFLETLEKYLPDQSKRQTLIVMPDTPTQDDLTSLSTISYALGSQADTNYVWSPEIVTGSQLNENTQANRNIIFINSIPNELQDQTRADKNSVALLPSPWGVGHAVLLIDDQNREDGFSPAAVFSDHARRVLLQGSVAYIDQHPLRAAEPFQNNISFEDLGYLDRTVRGIGQQNLIYSLYIPYDIDPTLVTLNLGLVHAPDLDIQNSSFTVYLNGFSVAGILPTARSSTGVPISVTLPAKKFRRGTNFIRVAFDLHVPHSSCDRALETVWATILNSSTLEINYRNNTPTPSLKYFPLPFSDDSGAVFVIPDRYNQKDLANISRLSFLIGNSAYEREHPPEVVTASIFSQRKNVYRNAILVGLPTDNSITQSANDLLPQPFVTHRNALREGYGVYLPTSNKDASLGMLQIMPSPWVKGGTVLILTGNDEQGLNWTWDVILNRALQSSFEGNLMVVGSAGRNATSGVVSSQESPQAIFEQIADASNIPIIGPILQRSGQSFTALSLVAVGTALFLIFCILLGIRLVMSRRVKLFTMPAKVDEEKDDEH